MPVSMVLTCVPEERGVHSEHKLSILSLFSRNGIFPRWPSLLGLPFIFSCAGAEGGLGQCSPTCPHPRLVGRIRPQHAEGWWSPSRCPRLTQMLEILKDGDPSHPRSSSARHLQAVFLWKSNLSAPSCGCLEITWYLMAPSHGPHVDSAITK